MNRIRQGSVLRRLGFLLGLVIFIVAACGVILATGNLIALKNTPDKLLSRVQEQYGDVLRQSGLPVDLIADFVAGRALSTNVVAELPENQRKTLSDFRQVLAVVATSIRQATEQSRKKSLWGIGICSVLLCFAVVLMIKASRRAQIDQNE